MNPLFWTFQTTACENFERAGLSCADVSMLRAIANEAADDGTLPVQAPRSLSYLGLKSRLGRTAAIAAISTLEKVGVISTTKRRGSKTDYFIDCGWTAQKLRLMPGGAATGPLDVPVQQQAVGQTGPPDGPPPVRQTNLNQSARRTLPKSTPKIPPVAVAKATAGTQESLMPDAGSSLPKPLARKPRVKKEPQWSEQARSIAIDAYNDKKHKPIAGMPAMMARAQEALDAGYGCGDIHRALVAAATPSRGVVDIELSKILKTREPSSPQAPERRVAWAVGGVEVVL